MSNASCTRMGMERIGCSSPAARRRARPAVAAAPPLDVGELQRMHYEDALRAGGVPDPESLAERVPAAMFLWCDRGVRRARHRTAGTVWGGDRVDVRAAPSLSERRLPHLLKARAAPCGRPPLDFGFRFVYAPSTFTRCLAGGRRLTHLAEVRGSGRTRRLPPRRKRRNRPRMRPALRSPSLPRSRDAPGCCHNRASLRFPC
jgi:hypothetical protein